MLSPELQEFATILLDVRNKTIESSNRRLRSDAGSVIAKTWKANIQNTTPRSFALTIIPDIVDDTIAQLLGEIDQGIFRLFFTASTGRTVDLSTEGLGELSGWYGGGGGWISRYSKERCSDDFSDLGNFFQSP
jgi:hypothetical protein